MTIRVILVFVLSIPLIGFSQDSAEKPDVLLEKAEEAFTKEDYKTSVEAYRRIIQGDPHHVKALHGLARLYATASDPDFFNGRLAVELALMAHDDAPDEPEIIDTLAMGYFAQNKFERAIYECLRCAELNPLEPYYYQQLKKFARTWMARLDITYPGSEVSDKQRAAFYLGKAHYHLDNLEEALPELERACRAPDADPEVYVYLARVKTAMGNPDQAVELIQSLAEETLENPEIFLELGRAHHAAGNLEMAALCLEDVYKQDPEYDKVRYGLGKVYLDMEKHVKAVLILKEAHEHLDRKGLLWAEEESRILYLLGKALAGAGELEEGTRRLLEAISLNVRIPDGENQLLSVCSKQLGSSKEFKDYLAGLWHPHVVHFSEISQKAGLNNTGSPAWGDFDLDGDPDLLLSGSKLFENNGHGSFADVTEKKGLQNTEGDAGIFGDYDNDGDLDIYVIPYEEGKREKLFRNDGRQGFKDVTEQAGNPSDVEPTKAAAFGDLNGDGFLDLYLANSRGLKGSGRMGHPDSLFLSTGNETFEGARKNLGQRDLTLNAQGVVMGDYDNDGDLDLFVSHDDLEPNRLIRNEGGGIFSEDEMNPGLRGMDHYGRYGNSRAAAFGDVDEDGDLDLFVANQAEARNLRFSDRSMFFFNFGPPEYAFDDQWERSSVLYGPAHYQSAMADVNNDGHLDLLLTSNRPGQVARLYLGRGDGSFLDITWLAGIHKVENAKGCAFGDIDLDGDLDLFIQGENHPYLFMNGGCDNHWIEIRLMGQSCNGTAIGARVTVDYEGKSQIREVGGGRGSACQDDMVVHFGLGSYHGKVNLSIQWPDGKSDFEAGLKADRIHTIKGRK